MLIGAERVIELIHTYRLCHIQGRFGAGKTALAVRLFPEFARRNYRMITNSRCVFGENLTDIVMGETGMLGLYVMLDEGGVYFNERDEATELISYAAKLDLVYVLPSFEPPHRKLRAVTIQPVKNWRSIGLPLVQYEYRLKSGFAEDKGTFFWLFPEEIYGTYSRQFPGDEPSHIMKWLDQQKTAFRRLAGANDAKNYKRIDFSGYIGQTNADLEVSRMETQRRSYNALADMGAELEEEIDGLKTILKGKTVLRRRR